MTPGEDAEYLQLPPEERRRLEADGAVVDWLYSNPAAEVTTGQVLRLAIGLRDIGRSDEMRAAALLRQLGWVAFRRKHSEFQGGGRRAWRLPVEVRP